MSSLPRFLPASDLERSKDLEQITHYRLLEPFSDRVTETCGKSKNEHPPQARQDEATLICPELTNIRPADL